MAMVISPKSKIVTLTLLIGIIIVIALIVVGVVSLWSNNSNNGNVNNNNRQPAMGERVLAASADSKMISSRLQQITSYTATKQVSRGCIYIRDVPGLLCLGVYPLD